MSVISYLIPQLKYRTSSSFNKDITVVEVNGKYRLLVNGIQQTGPYDEAIFKEVLKTFDVTHRSNVTSILMLGLGGGFVAKELHQHYPSAKITCVDIDPVMEKIAKRFFGLKDIHQITYVSADARDYIKTVSASSFDLVVVDLFIGDDIPSFVDSQEFLVPLRNSLKPGGVVVINYQSYRKYAVRRAQLDKHLSLLFSRVALQNVRKNCFFYAEV